LKSRFDCVRKKGEYQLPPLEQSMARTPDIFTIHYKEPLENHQGGTNPDMTIWAPSMPEMGKGSKSSFYTGVFFPSLENPLRAYADGSNKKWPVDQNIILLIEFTEDLLGMKIMVFRDQPAKGEALYQAWIDGRVTETLITIVYLDTKSVTEKPA